MQSDRQRRCCLSGPWLLLDLGQQCDTPLHGVLLLLGAPRQCNSYQWYGSTGSKSRPTTVLHNILPLLLHLLLLILILLFCGDGGGERGPSAKLVPGR
jgi:hypothetical protein